MAYQELEILIAPNTQESNQFQILDRALITVMTPIDADNDFFTLQAQRKSVFNSPWRTVTVGSFVPGYEGFQARPLQVPKNAVFGYPDTAILSSLGRSVFNLRFQGTVNETAQREIIVGIYAD